MVDIVTRLGKGSPLTNAEVDANFTNLAEVSGVTGEPMGHEDRTTSTISFNASTRTFTIAPTASSFTVWCKGKKVVVSSARTVTIPNTTGMYSIYFDSTGTLAAKSGYFTFAEEAPTAYIYWNATTGTAPYFGDERHGVVLDWQTHEYLHRTRGAALASGFSASGYVLGGNGSSNSHAQITLEGGTFFDEDMKIIVTATNTPTAGTWEQDLTSPARIPVLYLSGTAWVIDSPTDYPLKQGTARPQYNAYSGGVWSTADVANNKYSTTWILATNNLTYPVIAIIGQAESDLQSAAEAVDFTELQLPGFPSVEFRPLYKLIFQCADSCTNAVHASLVSITDIRSIAAAGTAASIVTDHGNLSGLSDDDHPQYLSVDTVRGSLTAAVKASFLPSQTSNAGKFLQTDGTATSWQALTSGNVTTALGFTPYNATNPSGFITGITSGNVTTALGFTPYNATNPSGYVTAAGARGSISVTGAGSYDSATGVINIVGGVTSFNTRTGAITLSSSDVTTALGFTPYNSTNPNGYLTGITSTQVTTALGYTPYNSSNPSGYITGITSGMVTTALGFTPYNNSNPSGYITSAALSPYLTTASAASTYLALAGGTLAGQLVIGAVGTANSPTLRLNTSSSGAFVHTQETFAANLTSGQHILSVIGKVGSTKNSGYIGYTWAGDASNSNYVTIGHWGNDDLFRVYADGNVTVGTNTVLSAGNYNSYALPLTGGTVTGPVTIDRSSGGTEPYIGLTVKHTGTSAGIKFQSSARTYEIQSGSDGAFLVYDRTAEAYRFTINSSGTLFQGQLANAILHAGNYNSYSPTLTGTGASGTWAINITGSAATATDSTKLPLSGGTLTGPTYISTGGNYPLQLISTQRYMLQIRNSNNSVNSGYGWWFATDTNFNFAMHADGLGDVLTLTRAGALTLNGNTVLHAGNYNSYSPTLTGGGASGTWGINISGSLTASAPQLAAATESNSIYITAPSYTTGSPVKLLNFDWYGNTWAIGNIRSGATPSDGFGVYFQGSEKGRWSSSGFAFQVGTAIAYDNSGGWNANIVAAGQYHARSRVRATSYNSSGDAEAYLWVDNTVSYRSGLYSSTNFNMNVSNLYESGNRVLNASNYSSYALPLSGGTLSGDLQLVGNYLRFDQSGTRSWNMRATGGNLDLNSGDGVGSFRYNGGVILTSNSYTSYALPLTAPSVQVLRFDTVGGEHITFQNQTSGQAIQLGFQQNDTDGLHHRAYFRFSKSNAGSVAGAMDIIIRSVGGGTSADVFRLEAGQAPKWGGSTMLTASNYSSYALPLSGGTMTGVIGSARNDLQRVFESYNTSAGSPTQFFIEHSYGNVNIGNARGAVNIQGSVALHAGNYNSYSPTLTGGNASGTWGINITGNAASVSGITAAQFFNNMGNNHSTYTDFNSVPGFGAYYVQQGGNSPTGTASHQWYGFTLGLGNDYPLSLYGTQLYWPRAAQNADTYMYVRDREGGSWGSWRKIRAGYADTAGSATDSSKLPLSGGTLSGNLTMNGPGSSTSIIFGDATKQINVEGYWMMFKGHQNEGFRWQTSDGSTYTTRMQLTSSALTMNGNTVVHAGNVSSYALPIGGGTLTSSTKIKAGHGDTRFQLHYNHDGADTTSGYAGYLTLWASEPGMSYAYTGIGGNINISGNYYGRQTSGQAYGLYLRFETASGFSEFWATTGAVGSAGGQGSRVAYIDAGGNGTFSGNVTAYSDERLKKDWAVLPADFIARLATVKSGTYTRVDSGARQAGSSAQDWKTLLPEVVSASNDEAQTLTLAYGNAALVSAVELAKDNVELRARIERLESLINKLIGD